MIELDAIKQSSKWRNLILYIKRYPIIPYGFWAKWGHWGHASVYIAIDHWLRGGKIRLRRW